MNYYNDIKKELINNEINKKVKDYSKNRSDLNTYYNVGKLLSEAGKHYGDEIIKKFSIKLTNDIGKRYSITTLKYIRRFYNFSKSHSVSDQLTYTHYKVLLSLDDYNEIEYYIRISINNHLSVRQLSSKIKSNEYKRLPVKTRKQIISNNKMLNIKDFVKSPLLIKNNSIDYNLSEKVLQKLILEDISSFLLELGSGFSFVQNEYRIKIGDKYNYLDLLLFNIELNCYVVVELKVTELRKEHVGQIQIYMNYIDSHLKKAYHEKTIGIIVVRKDNKFIMEYCSDERIISREYELV